METSVRPYVYLAASLFLLVVTAYYLASLDYLIPSAIALALFWQQTAFIGHDLGHSAVTASATANAALCLLINSAVGIGMSWWKSTHNVHHLVVNTADSDPDIQFMPLIAVSDHFFGPVWSRYHQDLLQFDAAAKRLVSWQHLTFLPLLMIARFGLYIQTVKQLLNGKAYIHRTMEIAAQCAFFFWYALFVACFSGPWRKVAFVLLSHAAFSILHLQVRGTMNWSCPVWLDWFHGGLQFQIEHHLFPRMPRHNLRAASKLVQAACLEAGLYYRSPTFIQAIVETLQTLRATAMQARQHQLRDFDADQSSVLRSEVLSRAFI